MPRPPSTGAASCIPVRRAEVVRIYEYVDFVRFDGGEYLSPTRGRKAVPVPADQIGRRVGTVRCRIASLPYDVEPTVPLRDLDAAYLSVGTALYALRGTPVRCGVAAHVDGVFRLYVRHEDVNRQSTPVPCARALLIDEK